MKSINYSTGMTEYAINGDENNVVRINIHDVNILKRIKKAQLRLEELEAKYAGKEELTAEECITLDGEIRKLVTEAFGTDVLTTAFGDTNCMTDVGDNTPIFAAFLGAFLPIIEEDIKAAAKAMQPKENPKIEKYIAPVITRQQPIAGLANPMGEIDIGSLTKEQKTALLAQLIS